jgi:hypothetical protein
MPLPETLPETITANLLYSESTDAATFSPEGCLCVSGNEILANVGAARLAYSSDLGQTWAERGDGPQTGAGWRLSKIQHDSVVGLWVIQYENTTNNDIEIYRSLDAGQTWEAISPGNYNDDSYHSMIIDSRGRMYFAARRDDWNISGIYRYDTPSTDTSATLAYVYGNPGFPGVNNMKEISTAIVISSWDGASQDIIAFPKDINADTVYDANLIQDNYAPWSDAFSNTELAIFRSIVNADATFDVFSDGVTPPLPQLTVTFGENIDQARINAGSNYQEDYLAMVARPSAGLTNRWLLRVGTSTSGTSFTRSSVITLPDNADSSDLQHIYRAGNDVWVGYYVSGGLTRIVSFSLAAYDGVEAFTRRNALVWNFEDDNYTWMDAAVDTGTDLTDVVCMHYAFAPGWGVRWQDLIPEPTEIWKGGTGTIITATTKWSDLLSAGNDKHLFWLATDGVYRSDQAVKTDGVKRYFVERVAIDLDDLVPEWTTNNFKHLRQFYFHLQSPTPLDGTNNFTMRVGWGKTLMDAPTWEPEVTVNLQETDSSGAYKADLRTTGRYLSIEMNFDTTNELKMSGGDMDVILSHGR